MEKLEWWESGFFDDDMAAVLFAPVRLRAAKKEAAAILRLTGSEKGGAVLDTACGPGRHSVEFARRGLRVTGVDITPAYLKAARRLARAAGVSARFEKADLRRLEKYRGRFDLVVNLFTSFGYFAKADDNRKALRQMAGALKPGGRLVLEIDSVKENLLLGFEPVRHTQIKKGWLLTEHHRLSRDRKKVLTHWVIQRPGRTCVYDFELWLYSIAELRKLFRQIGLKDVRIFGDWQGQKWSPGRRLIMVACR